MSDSLHKRHMDSDTMSQDKLRNVQMPAGFFTRPASQAIVQSRPLPRASQIKTFAQAMFTGKYAAPEVVMQRLEICRRCGKRRITPTGIEWCGICGCKVGNKSRQLDNLAAYEENLPKWGCKHPLRKKGKGWPVAQSAKAEGQRQKVEMEDSKPLSVNGPPPTSRQRSGGLGNGAKGAEGSRNGQKAAFLASGASRNGLGSSQNDSGTSQSDFEVSRIGSGTSQNGFGNSQNETGSSQESPGSSHDGSGSSRNVSGISQDGFGISHDGCGSSRKGFLGDADAVRRGRRAACGNHTIGDTEDAKRRNHTKQ